MLFEMQSERARDNRHATVHAFVAMPTRATFDPVLLTSSDRAINRLYDHVQLLVTRDWSGSRIAGWRSRFLGVLFCVGDIGRLIRLFLLLFAIFRHRVGVSIQKIHVELFHADALLSQSVTQHREIVDQDHQRCADAPFL